MTEPHLRPLVPEDAPAAVDMIAAANDAAARERGREPEPLSPERRRSFEERIAHFPVTDEPGCWVAEADDRVVGISVAIRRGPLWALSLLFVHPDHQSRGLGGRLVALTRPYAEGAQIEMVMASEDPRAIRRYAHLGLDLHPAVMANGKIDRSRLPVELPVRRGDRSDLGLVDAVDRKLRGGVSRADDVAFLLDMGETMHIVDLPGRRGFVLSGNGRVTCLGATDEETARELLWAALSDLGDEAELYGLTATQGWAVDVSLAAGLTVTPAGPMFVRGLPALPGPYLPSGVYF